MIEDKSAEVEKAMMDRCVVHQAAGAIGMLMHFANYLNDDEMRPARLDPRLAGEVEDLIVDLDRAFDALLPDAGKTACRRIA